MPTTVLKMRDFRKALLQHLIFIVAIGTSAIPSADDSGCASSRNPVASQSFRDGCLASATDCDVADADHRYR